MLIRNYTVHIPCKKNIFHHLSHYGLQLNTSKNGFSLKRILKLKGPKGWAPILILGVRGKCPGTRMSRRWERRRLLNSWRHTFTEAEIFGQDFYVEKYLTPSDDPDNIFAYDTFRFWALFLRGKTTRGKSHVGRSYCLIYILQRPMHAPQGTG